MKLIERILKFKNKDIFILVVLAAALYFFRLGDFSLYDAVETVYGEFIKGIRLTGDWLTLHYNGQIIFDKPPLYYWLTAALTYIFGFNELTIRMLAAFCGISTVLVTFLLGKSFYNRRTGFLAGLIVMTALQFIVQSRIAELDIVLTLLMTASLLFFWWAHNSDKKWLYLFIYLFMALATLTKGIIGLAIPAFTIGLFLILKKELYRLKEMKIIVGLLLYFALAAPWYIAEYLIHGQIFLNFAFGFLFLSRFTGVVANHAGPWYYYLVMIPLGFAPWSQFLPWALWRTWQRKHQPQELLMLCYIIPILIVFSIAKTKLPGYVLPLYPFLAISVAKLWHDFLTAKRESMQKPMAIAQLSFALVIGLIVFALIMFGKNYPLYYQQLMPNIITLEAILIMGGLASLFFFFFKKDQVAFSVLPIMIFAIIFSLIIQTLPIVEQYKGTKILAYRLKQIIKANDKIAAWQVGNRPGIVFYSPKPVKFLQSKAELFNFLHNNKGYCFTTKEEYKKLKGQVRVFSKQGELILLY